MTAAEEWRPVVGWEGKYEVSSLGNVKRIKVWIRAKTKGQNLKPIRYHTGRLHVCLCVDQVRKYKTIHSLVAASFIGPRPPGKEINHIDGDHTNNRATNLEYITPRENKDHAVLMGLTAWGEKNAHRKLLPDQVREIRALAGKESILGMSKRFGVCRPVIKAVLRGETHRRVT
jgi:hypothetical protein